MRLFESGSRAREGWGGLVSAQWVRESCVLVLGGMESECVPCLVFQYGGGFFLEKGRNRRFH